MRQLSNQVSRPGLLTLLLVWCLAASQVAQGSEFRFVVQDLANGSAAWSPSEVVVHTDRDLEGGLVFILENPTRRTHVFLVEGLFEEDAAQQDAATERPLRIYVAPGETVRARVSIIQLKKGEDTYRFFCPLHKADAELAGMIRLVSQAGGCLSCLRGACGYAKEPGMGEFGMDRRDQP